MIKGENKRKLPHTDTNNQLEKKTEYKINKVLHSVFSNSECQRLCSRTMK